MSRHDWYRNTKWDAKLEVEFFEKLKRARKHNRPQYLRIQALSLTESHPDQALELLDQYFKLGESIDLALAYHHQADAYLTLGQTERAIQSYRKTLRREAEFPNVKTNVYIEFPFLIVQLGRDELYDEATKILDENIDNLMFHEHEYKWNASKALICSFNSDHKKAKKFASAAIAASEITKSSFRHHPLIGLFRRETSDQKTYNKIRVLAHRR